MSRALVVGFGSIGQRHARLLAEIGCEVAVVSRRRQTSLPCFPDLSLAVESYAPDYIVIANETANHRYSLEVLQQCGFHGRVLVEKPIFSVPAALPKAPFVKAAVAYNLRFHPGLRRLKQLLSSEEIISAHAYCGQDLRTWRPSIDYRTSYSAKQAAGGGVLRDLSHELDYLLWMFGPWTAVAALGGRYSTLEIESDDCWGLLLSTASCPIITLQVNYIDRPGRRSVLVNTRRYTFVLDFILGRLETDGVAEVFDLDPDYTYREQHRAMLSDASSYPLCSLEQGVKVVELIAAIEKAAGEKRWVNA